MDLTRPRPPTPARHGPNSSPPSMRHSAPGASSRGSRNVQSILSEAKDLWLHSVHSPCRSHVASTSRCHRRSFGASRLRINLRDSLPYRAECLVQPLRHCRDPDVRRRNVPAVVELETLRLAHESEQWLGFALQRRVLVVSTLQHELWCADSGSEVNPVCRRNVAER